MTFNNFSANAAVVVQGVNATPVVTGVMIAGNTFNNNESAVRITGGNGTNNTTVSANVIGNTLTDNLSGMSVFGNGDSGGGNTVSAFIDGNTIKAKQTNLFQDRDGIQIFGATGTGSGNSVIATVSNNDLTDIPDDGIIAIGCGSGATGSFNAVHATITGNVVRYKQDTPDTRFLNSGIVVSGASGESVLSFCHHNSIVFEVTNNIVEGFKNNIISIDGGDRGTARNDVQGIVADNNAINSQGNPGGTNRGGTGILVTAGSGSQHKVHDITVTGNKVSGNPLRGIVISGGSSTDSIVTGITVSANEINGNPTGGIGKGITPQLDQDGILVTGSNNAVNAQLSEMSIDGNISKNNQRRGIFVTRGTEPSNTVSLSGITNNIASNNLCTEPLCVDTGGDGIFIASNVPGSGVTPVAGNQCNKNGEDGVDINSPGYSVSNNSCSQNDFGDGINAVVGNTNDGGNSGKRNAACNQPNFCFNTPLP